LLHFSARTDGELRMTQRQLADHLGTTREVVARILRDFVVAGFVETSRGLTLIRNADGLSQLISRA
jgi:CRP/FNR family transcriptional regulator